MFLFPERKEGKYLTLGMALRFVRDEPRRLGSSFGKGKSPMKAKTELGEEPGKRHAQIRSPGITPLDPHTFPVFLHMPSLSALPKPGTKVCVGVNKSCILSQTRNLVLLS